MSDNNNMNNAKNMKEVISKLTERVDSQDKIIKEMKIELDYYKKKTNDRVEKIVNLLACLPLDK
jgi:hypothetical protein